MKTMKPLKLIPACKDYIWGGTRLKSEFDKISDADIIAETWELSCHPDGESIIADGEHAGKTLIEAGYNIPIMIKLIDAESNLSVQVHPNDEQARAYNSGTSALDTGKTEMWYIVDAQPNAEIIYGLNREITREEFRERVENGTLLEVVNRVKVKKGDVFFIPARTLHAIGKGIVITEIQQNSNLTYRVYDYGRMGVDGKPRELHVEKAIAVTDLTPITLQSKFPVSCQYFHVNKVQCPHHVVSDSYSAVLVLEGSAEIDGVTLKKGETCFIPSGYGDYKVTGNAQVIITKGVM